MPGGKLLTLAQEAYKCLNKIEGTKIVYLMGGIPDICFRAQNKLVPYEENWFTTQKDQFDNLCKKFQTIISLLQSINCKVVIIPITTMNIANWNTHRLAIKKTKYLLLTKKYETMQEELNEFIHKINNYITEQNTKNKVVTPFIQSFVQRRARSRVKYMYDKLVDGVHPSPSLIHSWISKVNHAMQANEDNLSLQNPN